MAISVKVKRFIPKGGVNPNALKPYLNMEDKLREYFDNFDNRVPVSIPFDSDSKGWNELKYLVINPTDIIGFATDFDDVYIYIDITDPAFEKLLDNIDNCRIDIVSMISSRKKDKEAGSIRINKILKLIIRETGVK